MTNVNKSVIYNRSTKTKAELRTEGEIALQDFLRRGGVIQVDSRKSKTPKSKMTAKNSRGFMGGSSGFSNGFPRKVAGLL
jgi:hypothetical protein